MLMLVLSSFSHNLYCLADFVFYYAYYCYGTVVVLYVVLNFAYQN